MHIYEEKKYKIMISILVVSWLVIIHELKYGAIVLNNDNHTLNFVRIKFYL